MRWLALFQLLSWLPIWSALATQPTIANAPIRVLAPLSLVLAKVLSFRLTTLWGEERC